MSGAAVQLSPAAAGSKPPAISNGTGQLPYLLDSPWRKDPSGDPVVAYLETLGMPRLLDELSDAVACGYALKIEARVRASPRIVAALYAVELAQVASVTPSHPALQRAGTTLDQVPGDQLLQIVSWMLHRRGVSVEATALLEGVLAMRERGAAEPEPPPPGAGAGSRASSPASTVPAGVTMPGAPSSVEPGPWAPPGDQPISLYIGNDAHIKIAKNYEAAHGSDIVQSNFFPISSILRRLQASGHSINAGALSDTELGLMPDIVNLTRLHLYEIKPVNAQALGATKATLCVGLFGRAGVAMQLGPTGEPGTEGGIPAPGGVFMFWSPKPGVIVYQYRRGRLEPVPVLEPEPARERRWRFELKPLTREQQQAVTTLTVGGALLLILMIALSPVGA